MIKRFKLLGILFVISGCVSTRIAPSALPAAALHTAEWFEGKALRLAVKDERPEGSAGHQYLLVALPFGSVSLADPAITIQNKAYTSLLAKGYKPLLEDQTAPQGTHAGLAIRVMDAQVSAYDYLLLRRLVCSVKLAGTISPAPGAPAVRSASAQGEERQYRSYGFSRELTNCFEKAVDKCLAALMNELRL